MIRVCVIWEKLNFVKEAILFVALLGGAKSSYSCLTSNDIKLRIALSSIVHIRFCIVSIICATGWGIKARIILMFGHGLCSSGLFYLCRVLYPMYGSRRLSLITGALRFLPIFNLVWFLMCRVNIRCPPSINLLREIIIISSIIGYGGIFFRLSFIFILFFRACYRLYFYYNCNHNITSKLIFNINYNLIRTFTGIFHWLPLNVLILCTYNFFLLISLS